jgi:hypothetical protein
MSGSERIVVPVSASDVKRVVAKALSLQPRRLRLTSGQRLAIVQSITPRAGTAGL